jgi:antitoxin VapB
MSRQTARLFKSGGSQAVRLPAEFRFDGDVVYVRRDEKTGDVILSAHPALRWSDFVALRDRIGSAPADFLVDREQPSELRDPFSEP